ncbi:porin family protein [Vibrio sp. WXL103]|uniref:porin family protein n=1 Tax=unclassified Vibrio TaxID=2614977 RepID=UPI003EC8A9C0
MKFLLPALISSVVLSAGAFANDFSGHRVGLGYSKTELDLGDINVEWGTGIKLEYGYDINQIFGVNVSYAKHKESDRYASLDGSTFKIDTDIGYKFVSEGYSIKPYAAIGLAFLDEDLKVDDVKGNITENTIFVGLGLRADIGDHFYTDLRVDIPSFYENFDQASVTFGYRF